jgi:hypothetical protein
MSRLDSGIRRLLAQRDALDRAVELARPVPGIIIELGLGNGRTYDHLRERLPGREIFAFEMRVVAHPDSMPDPSHLILGDLRETLPLQRRRFSRRVALLHMDIASGYRDQSLALAAALTPAIEPLICPGGIVVSELPIEIAGWIAHALPAEVEAGRYHLYEAPRA